MRSDSGDNGDDSCKVVVPKLNKVLENININDVMTGFEHQANCEHLHISRKCHHQSRQTKLSISGWMHKI
jgi:hypothetical protein